MVATDAKSWRRQPTPPTSQAPFATRGSGLFKLPESLWTPRDRVRRAISVLRRQQALTSAVARAIAWNDLPAVFAVDGRVWPSMQAEASGVFGAPAATWLAYAVIDPADVVVAFLVVASGADPQHQLAIGYAPDGQRLVAEQVSAIDED